MFLAPEGDEIEIAHAAADFLGEAMPIDRLHAHGSVVADMDMSLRRRLGEMGWFALALAEDKGGSALSAVEHALFFREVGRQCGPIDVLAQALAAQVADDERRGALLAGKLGVAIALPEGDGLRLLGAPDARLALQVERDRALLFALNGNDAEARPALDPATSMRLLARTPPIATEIAGDTIWRLGMLGVAAMLVGIAEAALDQIVDYAKIRETFGRKIGSYQAVRHPCADMALRAEAARCQLWYAAAAVKEGRRDADTHLDAAKHLANQAAIANADTNIQLHGGIGVTDEHHAHLYLKHALLLAKLFGAKRPLLARLLAATVDD